LRGLRRPLRTATLIIAAEFGRYAASLGAPVVRDRGLNARYLVAIPSSALGRLRAAVGFTVNDRNRSKSGSPVGVGQCLLMAETAS